jgi:hypothetical protein
LSRFLFPLRLSLKPNIFDGCVEAKSITLLLKPDLFRRVLSHKSALCRSAQVSDRCQAIVQIQSHSHGHHQTFELRYWQFRPGHLPPFPSQSMTNDAT